LLLLLSFLCHILTPLPTPSFKAESAIAWAAKSDPDRQSKSTVESGGGSHSRAHASSNARSASVDNDEDDDDESARRAAAKLSVGDAAIQSVSAIMADAAAHHASLSVAPLRIAL